MQSRADEKFQRERERYRFLFSCEDCVYFDAARARCAHGYPTESHRRAAFEPGSPEQPMFCKEFEIA